nr:muscle-specific protein 20-like [Lytechinus pictus]
MASRPRGYGMTAELVDKKDAKFDPDLATEAFEWIAAVLETGPPESQELASSVGPVIAEKHVHVPLKDGVVLCHLINVIRPGSVKQINSSKMAFKQMENIGNFLGGCENLGISKVELFQTVDLYEANNIPQVVNGIIALGRRAQNVGYNGPTLGPEEATKNEREFTEEQLRAGEGVIGLQAGSNKGASQAGQYFGKTRQIKD